MKQSLHHPLSWIDDELADLELQGLLRGTRTVAGADKTRLVADGRELVNFGSNDYLGLAGDPRLAAAAARAATEEGWGAAASPLVTGHTRALQRLEEQLAQFEATEAALVFPSGYAANLGTIPALVGSGDTIFADQGNHASMIDGCRLSRATIRTYPHRDWRALEALLKHGTGGRRLIVSESIFSMDGDAAPLVELTDLAERHGAMLLVDEAHATGLFGANGRGLAEELGVEHRVHVRIGTLSKALASIGGFAVASAPVIRWLANRARPYVFSTALLPAACAAAAKALEIVRDEPQRRSVLRQRAAGLAAELREQGWDVGATTSPIIPILLGDPRQAVELASALAERGLLVPAIRPPSVPEGQSRLRISLNAGHAPEMIAALTAALSALGEIPRGVSERGA